MNARTIGMTAMHTAATHGPHTDSLPLDAEGLNTVCLRATAAAKAAEEGYAWAALQTPGTFIERKIRGLARVHHAKADALLALLQRAGLERSQAGLP